MEISFSYPTSSGAVPAESVGREVPGSQLPPLPSLPSEGLEGGGQVSKASSLLAVLGERI